MQNLKYAIIALIFIGITKLLQVVLFDADQYTKNKKDSFSKDIYKPEKKIDSEASTSRDIFKPTKKTEETPPPVLDSAANDSTEMTFGESSKTTEPNAVKKSANYSSLSDLKNNYLAPIVSKLPPGQLREDVVIRYYRHDKDEEKVYSLVKMGYYIHEKEATETAGLGSNILYYGEDVKIEDIRIVALALLEKGIPLKSIQRSRYDWKSNSIEIGTDPNQEDMSALTIDYILNFNKYASLTD